MYNIYFQQLKSHTQSTYVESSSSIITPKLNVENVTRIII